jgi:hypothetical protein
MGTTTMFRVEHIMSSGMLAPGLESDSSRSRTSDSPELKPLSGYLTADLYLLLLDATAVSSQLNDAIATKLSKLNPYTFNGTIILLGYRALAISSLSGSYQLNQFENAVHLGIAMFVTTFMHKLDRKIPDMPFLAESLRSLVMCGFDNDQSILLWILFLGEASVLNHCDHEWLLPLIAQVAQKLHLVTWEGVLSVLSKLPWINGLYNTSAQALWENASSHSHYTNSRTSNSSTPLRIGT